MYAEVQPIACFLQARTETKCEDKYNVGETHHRGHFLGAEHSHANYNMVGDSQLISHLSSTSLRMHRANQAR